MRCVKEAEVVIIFEYIDKIVQNTDFLLKFFILADNLKEVNVPIMKACKHLEDITGNEICAGEKDGGRDACQGSNCISIYNILGNCCQTLSRIKHVFLKRFKVILVVHYFAIAFRIPTNIT